MLGASGGSLSADQAAKRRCIARHAPAPLPKGEGSEERYTYFAASAFFLPATANTRLTALRNALALASTVSVETPRPR